MNMSEKFAECGRVEFAVYAAPKKVSGAPDSRSRVAAFVSGAKTREKTST